MQRSNGAEMLMGSVCGSSVRVTCKPVQELPQRFYTQIPDDDVIPDIPPRSDHVTKGKIRLVNGELGPSQEPGRETDRCMKLAARAIPIVVYMRVHAQQAVDFT